MIDDFNLLGWSPLEIAPESILFWILLLVKSLSFIVVALLSEFEILRFLAPSCKVGYHALSLGLLFAECIPHVMFDLPRKKKVV